MEKFNDIPQNLRNQWASELGLKYNRPIKEVLKVLSSINPRVKITQGKDVLLDSHGNYVAESNRPHTEKVSLDSSEDHRLFRSSMIVRLGIGPEGAEFNNWKPVHFRDGVYWEIEFKKGFFVLFSKDRTRFEITSGGSWGERGLIKFFGKIKECEEFACWVMKDPFYFNFNVVEGNPFRTAKIIQ